MGIATPDPKFPDGVWDGTTKTTPDVNSQKTPDVLFGARYRAEIRSIEAVLQLYLEALEKLIAYGSGNDVLGVKGDGTELEYKTLTGGTGITITHSPGGIAIATSGGSIPITVGENVSLGDALTLNTDGKAYKALADAEATCRVIGICDRNASADENVDAIAVGIMTNPSWSFTAGNRMYVSTTVAGDLTNSAPSTDGHFVVCCGRAATTTTLVINLEPRIKM